MTIFKLEGDTENEVPELSIRQVSTGASIMLDYDGRIAVRWLSVDELRDMIDAIWNALERKKES